MDFHDNEFAWHLQSKDNLEASSRFKMFNLKFKHYWVFPYVSISDEQELNVKEDVLHIAEEELDKIPKAESDDNLTITDPEEKPAEVEEEQLVRPDVSVEEDGGHFNKNKDNPLSFSTSDEMQKVPQATLENAFDMGLGVEVEHSPSG